MTIQDITEARDIFLDSMETLTANFPRKAMELGVDGEQMELHRQILRNFGDGSGQASGTRKEIERFAAQQGRKKLWDDLCKVKLPDGGMLIEVFQNTLIIKDNLRSDTP